MNSYLNQADILQYVVTIFSSTFSKVYNYSKIPKPKRMGNEVVKLSMPVNSMAKNITKVEELDQKELECICNELMDLIMDSLISMPQSLRYLLVTIAQCESEKVLWALL